MAVTKMKLDLVRARAIVEEWERRKALSDSPPYDAAHSYLKRSVYELVKSFLKREDGYASLEKAVRAKRKIDSRAPSVQENPFFWGFLLVFADNDSLGRSERSKFADELLYAKKHRVSAKLLIGFIYQVGGYSRIRKKLRAGEMEEWCPGRDPWDD
ncbi:hypothetical protein ACEUZ9_005368 [Paracoccus litorisediminis]|uniref:hypothetical protein n=1 Tax=Paracoccus litorisediminis TaxID=2006130 RepID=UPI0037348366